MRPTRGPSWLDNLRLNFCVAQRPSDPLEAAAEVS